MTTRYATEKQLNYLDALMTQRTMGEHASLVEAARESAEFAPVSAAITLLRSMPYAPRESASADPVTEAGMYRKDGTVYRVKLSRQGRLYATRLVDNGGCRGHVVDPSDPSQFDAPRNYCASADNCDSWSARLSFEYANSAIYRLSASDRMTVADAAQFGQQFGSCCVCGRTLTNASSIAAGIGPVCASRV